MGRKYIYNVEVLSDMRQIDMEWKACPPEVIANCFHHCLKRGKSLTNAERGVDNDATLNITEKDASDHGVTVSSSGLERLLHVSEGDDVIKDPTIEQIGCEVAGVGKVAQAEANDDEHVVENEISVEEELKCLTQARDVLKRRGILCDASRRFFITVTVVSVSRRFPS